VSALLWLLLGISFFLHIITIFAIIILYQKKSVDRLDSSSTSEEIENLEGTMALFMEELEKGNEQFYQNIIDYVKEKETQTEVRLRLLEAKLQESPSVKVSQSNVSPVKKESSPIKEIPQYDAENMSREEKIERTKQLFQQGFSIEQIEKVLHYRKGEIEFIVNLLKQSEVQKRS
jgi:GTPase involved in cell partitioning and DNA repair